MLDSLTRFSKQNVGCHSRLVLLSIAAVVMAASGCLPKDAPPRTVEDPVEAALLKKGYVAVPMKLTSDGHHWMVECKSVKESFRMLVDSGAASSLIDTNLGSKLGTFESDGDVELRTTGGKVKGRTLEVRSIQIGDFDSRFVAGNVELIGVDGVASTSTGTMKDADVFHGMLGHAFFKKSMAVIDYSSGILYLRYPIREMWPQIKGEWTATKRVSEGLTDQLQTKKVVSIKFDNDVLTLLDGENKYVCGMHILPMEEGRYRLFLLDPDTILADKAKYKHIMLIQIKGEKLSVCFAPDPSKIKEWPEGFTAPEGSGLITYEFIRKK